MKQEHILVCLSASPSNPHIIMTASAMAKAFDAAFTAVYIEPISRRLYEEDEKRLHENMELAASLKARVETIPGDDIAYQIAEFAAISGVTRIVIGTAIRPHGFFARKTVTDQLISYAKNIDVYIVPDHHAASRIGTRRIPYSETPAAPRDLLLWALSLMIATVTGLWFRSMNMADSNIIPLYILAVLVISVVTSRSIFGLGAAVTSVFIFNFFFTAPYYTLRAYDPSYWITFIVMLISALLTSSLAVRIKRYAGETAQRAYRTQTLLDTNQLLQQASSNEEISAVIADQLQKLLNCDLIFYIAENGELQKPYIYSTNGNPHQNWLLPEEKAAASWSLEHHHHSGRGTSVFPDAKLLYLSVNFHENSYGVVGLNVSMNDLDPFAHNLVISILGECSLAMENARNTLAKEEAAVYAKNQQLRADLLRTLSHDLRTPLTSISGNASTLLANEQKLDSDVRRRIYQDIEEDSQWLIETVENLLATTKLENGRMSLHMESEVLDEVVSEALRHVSHEAIKHRIVLEENDDIMLARMDVRLIMQVIINLVNNAIKYTPEGSLISIRQFRKDGMACISVSDDGPGISAENKPHIFEMFFSGREKIADSRRSLGLGLALCRSIAEAHGGTITLEDNEPHGCIFTFSIPEEEVILHEE